MKAFLSSVGFMFLVACGGGGVDGVIKEYEGFKDKMCACKDKACAEKVSGKFKTWIAGFKKVAKQQARGDLQIIIGTGQRAGECLKAQGVEIPQ